MHEWGFPQKYSLYKAEPLKNVLVCKKWQTLIDWQGTGHVGKKL